MSDLNFIVSGSTIFFVILWAIVILLFFKVAKKYIPLVFEKKLNRKTFRLYFSISEVFIWTLYFVIVANTLINKAFFEGIAFLIFFLFVSILILILFFKDYLSGLILKMEMNLSEQDYIYSKDFEGWIIKFSARNLVIENKDSEIIIVPYYKLLKDVIKVKKSDANKYQSYSFVFEVAEDKISDFQSFKVELTNFLINLPWVKANSLPDITKEAGLENKVKVNVYPVMIKFVHKIENACKEKFGNNEE